MCTQKRSCIYEEIDQKEKYSSGFIHVLLWSVDLLVLLHRGKPIGLFVGDWGLLVEGGGLFDTEVCSLNEGGLLEIEVCGRMKAACWKNEVCSLNEGGLLEIEVWWRMKSACWRIMFIWWRVRNKQIGNQSLSLWTELAEQTDSCCASEKKINK